MQFGVLGPLQVVQAGVGVPLVRTKERRLLAALLVHLGESLSA
jgi:DNA-binding SARP family transcriptional activator